MLELVDLTAFGSRRVDQLSGGQRQRVALARALAIRPRVLLLADPLPAPDARRREQLRVEIDRLLRSLGITAVYVTHDQAEAMALGDRIVVMGKGRIAQAGPPQEIYHRPATAFVADFIGTMNRIVRDGREMMFRPEDARIVPAGSHHLEAKGISSFFLGAHPRLVVDAGGAAPLIVETPERRMWPRGETVHIAIA